MYLKKAFYVIPLFAYASSAFSLEFFSPGLPISVNQLGGAAVTFTDAPNSMIVKLALQNPDNSLTSIDSTVLYNVKPATLTIIRIPGDITPAINYFMIAIDSSNPNNYASMGPFVIHGQNLGSYPSTSSTVASGTIYATGAHSATVAASKPTVTGSPSTPTGSPSKPAATDPSSTPTGGSYTSLPFPVIIGIAVGSGLFVAIFVVFMVIWCCCVKKELKFIDAVSNQPNHMGENSSTLPLTSISPSITHSPTKNQTTNTNKPKPSPKQSKPPLPSTPTFASTNLSSDYALNVDYETNHNYSSPQGNSPSYPQQQFQYPNEIGMPVPVHYGDKTAYSSPTFNHDYNPFHEQKSYYPEQWPAQQSLSPTTSKLEVTPKESVLSQKVEYDGITADNKAEYIQKPDDKEVVFQKPNAADHKHYVYKNKPNRRSI